VLKKFRPSIWLPSIMIAWGIVMTLMGLVKDYYGLLICRLCLGIAEAGLYPGVAYYLTMWYCCREIQWVRPDPVPTSFQVLIFSSQRQGLFFSAASIAGAFSGLLAYAIVQMDGIGGEAGWRWMCVPAFPRPPIQKLTPAASSSKASLQSSSPTPPSSSSTTSPTPPPFSHPASAPGPPTASSTKAPSTPTA
jgi:MFS family permease